MEKRTGKFQLGRFWIEKGNLLPKVGVVVPGHQYIDAGPPTLEVLKTQQSYGHPLLVLGRALL